MKKSAYLDYANTYLLAVIAISLTVSMVFFPEDAFAAALKGLDVWWSIVFPALLPFFIGSELLIGLGVVHFMGILLEPLMRPVFNVPGVGSFVMAMGLASGFPIGSILTSRLRRQELCSKVEGERLMSFTNTADPLFMFGAVAVGMFGLPQVGVTIAAAHYLSSLTTGILLRFYGRNRPNTPEVKIRGNIILKALQTLYDERKKDGRPLGKLMGDAVLNSVNTLLLIGGYIILFSVIIRILTTIGIVAIMARGATFILAPFGFDPLLTPAIISGFFEVTLGCQLAADASAATPLVQKVMVASAVIAWSGLSVHAQVASIISGTGMKILPFIAARSLHAVLAAFYAFLLWGPLAPIITGYSMPVFLNLQQQGSFLIWQRIIYMGWRFILITIALILLGLLVGSLRKIKISFFRF